MKPRDHIVVAGAGIIGASIAYQLAKRGARVTILDRATPGAGATGKSLGWLNATFSKRPRAYFDLNCAGIAAWHDLEREFCGELTVQWGGSIAWFPPGAEAEQLAADVRHHQAWGYAVRPITPAEVARALPRIAPGDIASACHAESEGAVDPVAALEMLLLKAREFGAELHANCEVVQLLLTEDRGLQIVCAEGTFVADRVVLACGVDSPGLAQAAGVRVPLKASPGVLVHTTPAPRLVDSIILAPGTHFKQSADGRFVAGGQIVAGVGTAITKAELDQAAEIRQLLEIYVPALRGVEIERVTLGHRVMPVDEYPIVGFADPKQRLYVAATHSGVTLAPLIGRMAAAEILDGISVEAMAPYRPSRFC